MTLKGLHQNIPEALHRKLKTLASSKGITIRQALTEAIEAYLKAQRVKAA